LRRAQVRASRLPGRIRPLEEGGRRRVSAGRHRCRRPDAACAAGAARRPGSLRHRRPPGQRPPAAAAAALALTMPHQAALAALAVVVSQFSNAFGATWAKSLFPAVGPEGSIALRVGFSAILLVLATRAWRVRVARDQIGNLVAYGVALGLMNSFAYQAFARIPVGIGMAIEVTGPLVVVIYNSRRLSDVAWLLCIVAGLVLLLFKDAALPTVDPVGVALSFCSAHCLASYIV